ncbi:MAG TPA: hypothetical protein VF188_16195 [Longimicrobiales bacterium]
MHPNRTVSARSRPGKTHVARGAYEGDDVVVEARPGAAAAYQSIRRVANMMAARITKRPTS